jgi:hypothetical protein
MTRFERLSAYTGVAAVALWVIGLMFLAAIPSSLSEHATDQQILAWVQGNKNDLLLGGWIFMVGCLCFVWFAGVLRSRLLAAEGGSGTVSTLVFGGAVATAVFGMATPAGDVAAAINQDSISAATAGTLHHLTDLFFVCAELSAILVLAGVAILGFRFAVVPKWWAVLSAVVAVVLVIGPIGWAGLIYGLPIWTLGTTVMLVRGPRRRASVPTPATA